VGGFGAPAEELGSGGAALSGDVWTTGTAFGPGAAGWLSAGGAVAAAETWDASGETGAGS